MMSEKAKQWNLTAVLGAVVAVGAAFVSGTYVFKGNVVSTTAGLVKLVGDSATPDYARTLALTALLQRKLLDPDVVFDAAYHMEDQLNARVMTPLFYYAGREKLKLEAPLGYLDFAGEPLRQADGVYYISGWTLSRWKIARVRLICPDLGMADDARLGLQRKDIAALFPGLGAPESRMMSGFEYAVPADLVSGKRLHLMVRVWDDHFHFREIFSREVYFVPLERTGSPGG